MRRMIWIASLSVCASSFANVGLTPCRINSRHIESGGVGYNTGYSTLEAFLSSDVGMCPFLFFGDIRGHIFNDGKWAANVGTGVRGLFWSRALGINAYYDFRDTSHLRGNQFGLGVESLGTLVDIRANGYLPLGMKVSNPYDTSFGYFEGNQMYLSQKRKMALKGADAELGFHFGKDSKWMFYGALGPYYYLQPRGSAFWGGRASLSASFKHYITLEVSDSLDRVFHNRLQGQIFFTIPLGRAKKEAPCKVCPSDALACRKIQPVRRNEIVVMKKHTSHPLAINPANGAPYNFIFVNNLSASSGTYESPYHSLSDAEINSSPYDIIYVYPGDGTTRNMDSGIALQNFQKLWGTGTEQSLTTTLGAVNIPTFSSSLPSITSLTGDGVTLADYNDVSGIKVTDTANGKGIVGSNITRVNIANCVISNTGKSNVNSVPIGIGLLATTEPANININNNQINSCVNGVSIQFQETSFTPTIAVNNNLISNLQTTNSLPAIYIGFQSTTDCDVEIVGNTIDKCTNMGGILIGNTSELNLTTCKALITNNTITNTDADAIAIYTGADSCDVTVIANYVSNNKGNGFILGPYPGNNDTITNATVFFDRNQFINSSGNTSFNGINIYTAGGSSISGVISNNILSNNNGTGILSYNFPNVDNINFKIFNNQINGNLAQGININGFNSLTGTIARNNISDNNNGSSIGKGNITPAPSGNLTLQIGANTINDGLEVDWYGAGSACLTMRNNASTLTTESDPAYTLTNNNGGVFTIAPVNYEQANTGSFNTSGTSSVSSCGK